VYYDRHAQLFENLLGWDKVQLCMCFGNTKIWMPQCCFNVCYWTNRNYWYYVAHIPQSQYQLRKCEVIRLIWVKQVNQDKNHGNCKSQDFPFFFFKVMMYTEVVMENLLTFFPAFWRRGDLAGFGSSALFISVSLSKTCLQYICGVHLSHSDTWRNIFCSF